MRYPFTVLTLRPDYATDNYGEDTFLAHVKAKCPEDAAKVAQGMVFADYLDGADVADLIGDPEDFRVLCMFPGHLDDLSAGIN